MNIRTCAFPQSMEQKQTVCDQFQVGDIISTHVVGHKHVEKVDFLIVFFQQLAKLFGFADKKCDSSVVHIAIVSEVDKDKGRVLISEAMPSKKGALRTVDLLSHQGYGLDSDTDYRYEIHRPNAKFEATAISTAKAALHLSPKASYLNQAKPAQPYEVEVSSAEEAERSVSKNKKKKLAIFCQFSFTTALKAMFTSKTAIPLNKGAQKRIFKRIYEQEINSSIFYGGHKGKKIFCSAFIMQLFQRIEGNEAYKGLQKELQESMDQLKSETEGLDYKEAKPLISKWAKEMAEQHGDRIVQGMRTFKNDAKFITPQEFLEYMEQQGVTHHEFDLVAPS